jgi:multidrug efflux pump subunit AcrA (membrane-fusion protein)
MLPRSPIPVRRSLAALAALIALAGPAGGAGTGAPSTSSGAVARASIAGVVLALRLARPGQHVTVGAPLAFVRTRSGTDVVTAVSSIDGVVEEVFVTPGQFVAIGDPIARVASREDGDRGLPGPRAARWRAERASASSLPASP